MIETAAWTDNELVKATRIDEPLHLRRLSYPFPSRISPHAQGAQAHNARWLREQRLIDDPAERDRFERSQFGIFAGRVTPGATAIGLDWITDWCVWLFAFDDHCDETALGLHPGALAMRGVALLHVVDYPEAAVSADDRFASALADLRDRFTTIGSPQQWARFISTLRGYLLGIAWEAAHREAGEMPSIEDYIPMRVRAGAMPTVFATLDAICGYELASASYHDPDLTRLRTTAVNLVDWCNDLYSYGRESTSQESMVVHNLVAVIARERASSRQHALDEARRMHDAELSDYLALLTTIHPRGDATWRRYLDAFGMWLSGNEAWSAVTARYQAAEHLTIHDGPSP